jgi:hypothetical protein
MIKRADDGESLGHIALSLSWNRSTVATIYKRRMKSLEYVKNIGNLNATIVASWKKWKKLLQVWIKVHALKRFPISAAITQATL